MDKLTTSSGYEYLTRISPVGVRDRRGQNSRDTPVPWTDKALGQRKMNHTQTIPPISSAAVQPAPKNFVHQYRLFLFT